MPHYATAFPAGMRHRVGHRHLLACRTALTPPVPTPSVSSPSSGDTWGNPPLTHHDGGFFRLEYGAAMASTPGAKRLALVAGCSVPLVERPPAPPERHIEADHGPGGPDRLLLRGAPLGHPRVPCGNTRPPTWPRCRRRPMAGPSCIPARSCTRAHGGPHHGPRLGVPGATSAPPSRTQSSSPPHRGRAAPSPTAASNPSTRRSSRNAGSRPSLATSCPD